MGLKKGLTLLMAIFYGIFHLGCDLASPPSPLIEISKGKYINENLGLEWVAPPSWEFQEPKSEEDLVLVFLVKKNYVSEFQPNFNLVTDPGPLSQCRFVKENIEHNFKQNASWTNLDFIFNDVTIAGKEACRVDYSGHNREISQGILLGGTIILVENRGEVLIFTFLRETEFTVSVEIDDNGLHEVMDGVVLKGEE